MSLTRTTLSQALPADSDRAVLASITGLALNHTILIDGERMRVLEVPLAATSPVRVFRGSDGTKVKAHPVTSGVAFGAGSDFSNIVEQLRKREMASYSAAGAVALPAPGNDGVAILNSTTALAMTLANPGKDQDGDILIVIGNGKAAHTLTYTAGIGAGGSGLDVMTFDTNAQCSVMLMAANEVWVALASPLSGTLTGADVAIA